MSIHPAPTSFALRVGSAGVREFFWEAIRENRSPGIQVSDRLPIDVTRGLASHVDPGLVLVITDSPSHWEGFAQVSPGVVDAIFDRIRLITDRTDSRNLAMLVFDVSVENWSTDLVNFCDLRLRQGRSDGVAVVVRGPVAVAPEVDPRAFGLALAEAAGRPFPTLVARYQRGVQEWAQQDLELSID